jgi:hypothetical protein
MRIVNILILLILVLFVIYYLTFLRYLHFENVEIIKQPPKYTKKIAICISGQFRDINTCMLNHKSLQPLQPDYFVYVDDNLNKNEKEKILNFYQPKKIVWDSKKVSAIKDYPTNMIYMFKRIYLADKLRRQFEKENNFKYDVVIRLRPDLLLKDFIPEKIINNIQENSLYIPIQYKGDIWWSNINGPTDMIAIGDSDTMKIYCDCYKNMENLDVDTCPGEKIIVNHYMDLIKNVYTFKMGFVLNDMRLKYNVYDIYKLLKVKVWGKKEFFEWNKLSKCLKFNRSSKMKIKFIE